MQKKLTRNPKDRGKNKPRQKAKDKKEKQPFLVCLSHFVRGRHYGWSSSLTSFLLGLFSTNTLTLASTDLLTTDTATRPVQGSGLEVTRHRPDTACSCATGRCLPSLPGEKSPGTSGAMRLSSWAPHWCQPAAIPPTWTEWWQHRFRNKSSGVSTSLCFPLWFLNIWRNTYTHADMHGSPASRQPEDQTDGPPLKVKQRQCKQAVCNYCSK